MLLVSLQHRQAPRNPADDNPAWKHFSGELTLQHYCHIKAGKMPVRFDGRICFPAYHQWPKQVVAKSIHQQCFVAPDVVVAAASAGAPSVGRSHAKLENTASAAPMPKIRQGSQPRFHPHAEKGGTGTPSPLQYGTVMLNFSGC